MFERFRNPRFLRRLLAVALFLGMLGAFVPVVFNDGSSMGRYIAKQHHLEMVAEEEVEDYFEAVLYGEGEVGEAPEEIGSADERRDWVGTLFFVDRWLATALLVIAALLLVPKVLDRSRLRHLLPVLSLWLVVEAIGATLNGGKAHAELTLFARATRWSMPLVLWGMVWKSGKEDPDQTVSSKLIHLAVVCTSLTFAIHGWEAFRLHASFQDLIHGFFGLLGMELSPGAVALQLRVIGVMDLILAVTILFYRRPGIFLWMVCWGLITAMSRPLTLGFDAWPELAMRAANFALPLFLFFVHSKPKTPPHENS